MLASYASTQSKKAIYNEIKIQKEKNIRNKIRTKTLFVTYPVFPSSHLAEVLAEKQNWWNAHRNALVPEGFTPTRIALDPAPKAPGNTAGSMGSVNSGLSFGGQGARRRRGRGRTRVTGGDEKTDRREAG